MKDLDDFAVAAMQGLLARHEDIPALIGNETWQQTLARAAFDIAEAMQAESKKRREQAQAAPTTSDQGWIEWHGGACPVSGDVAMEFKLRGGHQGFTLNPRFYKWGHLGHPGDIVAYKVIK